MTQLSDTMKINLEMAEKLNLKATQTQETEDKRLTDIARKNYALKGTWTRTATSGHTGSELPSSTVAKRAKHQRQTTKGRQV